MKSKKHSKLFEWQERAKSGKEKCRVQGCESKIITVDHIIPISVLMPLYQDSKKERWEMIYNDEENFDFLCQYHNKMKNCQLDIRHPKTIPLLKRLIESLEKL